MVRKKSMGNINIEGFQCNNQHYFFRDRISNDSSFIFKRKANLWLPRHMIYCIEENYT